MIIDIVSKIFALLLGFGIGGVITNFLSLIIFNMNIFKIIGFEKKSIVKEPIKQKDHCPYCNHIKCSCGFLK